VELIAAEKEVLIRYDPPPDELNFMGDQMRLIRIYLNLLGNAIKCSPDGGTIEVMTRYVTNSDGMLCDAYYNSDNAQIRRPQPGQRYLLTEISDRGPGIKEGFKNAIFHKFSTLKYKNINSPSGIGLGLAFCKLAVEAHQGFIWVKSPIYLEKTARGYGSRFYFVLPAEAKVSFDSLGMEF
jgi:signal transduction histidine kinase